MFGNYEDGGLIEDNSFKQKHAVRSRTLYSTYHSWGLANYMVKIGDDVRQEFFAMQLLYEFSRIFKKKNLKLLLTPYEIIPIGPEACLVEMVQDSTSLDSLKKNLYQKYNRKISLFEFFSLYFGSKKINKARRNFCNSLSAYCLVSYFLQLKDRHNGNILLHRDGRIVHIDFGFLFTTLPGGAIEKKVPFKLTSEYVAVLGDKSRSFVVQFRKGFDAICEQKDKILQMFRLMISTKARPVKCLENYDLAYRELEERLNPPKNPKERREFVNR